MYPNSKHNLILLMLKKFNCKILTKIDISWYMAKLLNRSLLSKLGQIRTFVFGYFSFNNEIAAFAVKVLFIFVLPQTGQNLVLLHVIIVTVCLKLTRGNEHAWSMSMVFPGSYNEFPVHLIQINFYWWVSSGSAKFTGHRYLAVTNTFLCTCKYKCTKHMHKYDEA